MGTGAFKIFEYRQTLSLIFNMLKIIKTHSTKAKMQDSQEVHIFLTGYENKYITEF